MYEPEHRAGPVVVLSSVYSLPGRGMGVGNQASGAQVARLPSWTQSPKGEQLYPGLNSY